MLASLLGARTLLGAPGIATNTSNKKLLAAPGLTTWSKDATRGSFPVTNVLIPCLVWRESTKLVLAHWNLDLEAYQQPDANHHGETMKHGETISGTQQTNMIECLLVLQPRSSKLKLSFGSVCPKTESNMKHYT